MHHPSSSVKIPAFTLVELVVVTVIIALLGTVGFVLYTQYLTGARDSTRISQLTRISDAMQIYSASYPLPIPGNALTLSAGTNNAYAYQGDLTPAVLGDTGYSRDVLDPKDDLPYTYMLSIDKRLFQLMTLMETEAYAHTSPGSSFTSLLTPQTHADFTLRYPRVYGNQLGIITDMTNTPLHTITTSTTLDILTTTTDHKVFLTDTDIITGSGSDLTHVPYNASCLRLQEGRGIQESGIYTIAPEGQSFKVYCDMETDGGGWTLVARNHPSGIWGTTPLGWKVDSGDLVDTNTWYSLDTRKLSIPFSEIIYGNRKNFDTHDWGEFIFKFSGVPDDFLTTYGTSSLYLPDRSIVKQHPEWTFHKPPHMQTYIGYTDLQEKFFMGDLSGNSSHGIYPNAMFTTYCSRYLDGTSLQYYAGPFCDSTSLGRYTAYVMLMVR